MKENNLANTKIITQTNNLNLKPLSPIQAHIYDILTSYMPSYIEEVDSYSGQKLKYKIGRKFKTIFFTRPTLEVLKKIQLIEPLDSFKNTYVLKYK